MQQQVSWQLTQVSTLSLQQGAVVIKGTRTCAFFCPAFVAHCGGLWLSTCHHDGFHRLLRNTELRKKGDLIRSVESKKFGAFLEHGGIPFFLVMFHNLFGSCSPPWCLISCGSIFVSKFGCSKGPVGQAERCCCQNERQAFLGIDSKRLT